MTWSYRKLSPLPSICITHSFLELVFGLPLLLESTEPPSPSWFPRQPINTLALPSDDAPAALWATFANLLQRKVQYSMWEICTGATERLKISVLPKLFLVLHLLFCIEGTEVVVVGELSPAADVSESKETYSVHPVHWPARNEYITMSEAFMRFLILKEIFSALKGSKEAR